MRSVLRRRTSASFCHAVAPMGSRLRAVAIEAERLATTRSGRPSTSRSRWRSAVRYPFSDDGVPSFPSDAKWFDGMVVLGHVAALTSRIRIGTAVIPLFNRDPLSLAKQAATVDCLSAAAWSSVSARGGSPRRHGCSDIPTDARGRRLDEAIDVLRAAWSQPPSGIAASSNDIPPVGVSPKPIQGADVPIGSAGPVLPRSGRRSHAHAETFSGPRICPRSPGSLGRSRMRGPTFRSPGRSTTTRTRARCAERAHQLVELGVDRLMLSPPGRLDRTPRLAPMVLARGPSGPARADRSRGRRHEPRCRTANTTARRTTRRSTCLARRNPRTSRAPSTSRSRSGHPTSAYRLLEAQHGKLGSDRWSGKLDPFPWYQEMLATNDGVHRDETIGMWMAFSYPEVQRVPVGRERPSPRSTGTSASRTSTILCIASSACSSHTPSRPSGSGRSSSGSPKSPIG